MKKIFTILCALAFASSINAQSVIVATCSSPVANNDFGPMNSDAAANSTSRNAHIYPASQLAGIADQILTNVYFQRNAAGSAMLGTPTLKIYFKDTSIADFGATAVDWATAITDATLVYDGNPTAIVGTTAGYKNFPLLVNFPHAGTKNLAVFFEYNNPSASNVVNWNYSYTAPCVTTTNNNTSKYTINTTGVFPPLLSTANFRRPFIAFDIVVACAAPSTPVISAVTGASATFSWTAATPAPSVGYDYFLSTSATLPTAGTTPTGTTAPGVTTVDFAGLNAGSAYYVYVRSNCGGAGNSSWTGITFYTVPVNDECANAIMLTQGSPCVTTSGTTAGATQSQAATPCTGTPDDDVWYSFVATAEDAQITFSNITAVQGTSTTLYFQVFSGDCTSLQSMVCFTTATAKTIGGLTPGDTYYFRAYLSGAGTSASFNVCVTDVPAAPAACTTLSSPATNATVSSSPTLSWTTTTNASAYDIYLDQGNPPSTLYATVYNATTYVVNPPLSSGVYFWNVVPRNSLGGPADCAANTRTFTAVAPPANDDCSGAISLTSSSNQTCAGTTAGTTVGATASAEVTPACSATGANDDVWYSFVATHTTHTVNLTTVSSTSAVAIYSGSCGMLTELACASTNAGASNLTVGNTYYVRVYTTSATTTTTATFNICVIEGPVNDDCAAALPITLTPTGGTCTVTAVNTAGATISTVTGQANACTGTGIDDDVWYTFTTAGAGSYTFSHTGLTAVTGTASTVGMNIYTGSCGTLTEVAGTCNTGFGNTTSGTVAYTLAASTTYTLRLWVGSSTNTGTFNFCIEAPLVNDDCSGAISLTAYGDATCVSPTAGETTGASASPDAAPSCSATGANDDVWYKFTATQTNHTITIGTPSTTTAVAVYTGVCGSLVQISNACNSTVLSVGSLTIGTEYYLRVYSTSTSITTFSTFTICVTSEPSVPINDNCSGAIALPAPSATNTCTNSITGTTAGATVSPDAAPACSATGINDDVWYSFVATAAVHAVVISNATTTTGAAIYSGVCGALVPVTDGCTGSADGAAIATGLTIGTTYYVRVYSTATTATTSNFSICVISGAPNDECATAINVPVSTDNSCSNAVAGTTAGATATTGETVPTCSPTGINDDVWYSFQATNAVHNILLLNSTSTAAAQVYSGSCGGLVALSCASTSVTASGLTIGDIYYVRVYSTSTTAGTVSAFDICIGVPITNDECTGAITIPVSANGSCNGIAGTTVGSTQSTTTPLPNCGTANAQNDDVWYSFTATETSHVVKIENASSTTAATVYSGTCAGGLTIIGCASTTIPVTGLTAGQTYLVRVYTSSTTATTFSNFTICVSTAPINDECSVAIEVSNATGPVQGGTLGATQSMAPEACNGSTAAAANDVWYSFYVANPGSVTVNVYDVSASFDAVLQVYSGTCGAFTPIGCADGPGAGGAESVVLSGLAAGQSYYFRVYGFSATIPGTFTVSVTGAALPVSVEYFTGRKQGPRNLLDWKVNCTGAASVKMELQQSADKRTFTTIYTGTETSTRCLQPFTAADNSPAGGTNYYRLKLTDPDGRITFSNIIAISNKETGFELISIAPNPVRDAANLSLSASKAGMLQLTVTDLSGRIVLQQKAAVRAGSNSLPLPSGNLAAGTYVMIVADADGKRSSIRFVKH